MFDVETTGSKRNWDRIIAISFLAYDEEGKLLGSFSRKINPGKARISNFLSDNIHGKLLYIHELVDYNHFLTIATQCLTGIRNQDLVNEEHFPTVGRALNKWFTDQLQDTPIGVLVSHNTATDIQFICCEYIRAGIEFPPQIQLGLDTMKTLKRFSSICYRKVSKEDWPQLTNKGALSMGVKPCAIYALRHRDPPKTFSEVCGTHHDADADTRAVAVILFDQKEFTETGLHHCVFNSTKKCFQPIADVWEAMQSKLEEPVLILEPPPSGWVTGEVRHHTHTSQHTPPTSSSHITLHSQDANVSDPLSASSDKLPEGIPEVKEKAFLPPPGQRGEGEPSAKLREHLGVAGSRRACRNETTSTLETIMLNLFLFFFTIGILTKIAEYTNDKATEVVWKYRQRRADGKFSTKVCVIQSHII